MRNTPPPTNVSIRPAAPADAGAIAALLRDAFGNEAEVDLVAAMRHDPALQHEDVAEADGVILGHALWCEGRIAAGPGDVPVPILGEMCVTPDRQRQGVGSALVRHGIDRLRRAGAAVVLVVGHPDYYPRFGFSAERATRWDCAWAGPPFMAAVLDPGAALPPPGRVRFPAPYDAFA